MSSRTRVGTLLDEHAHRVDIAEARAGTQRVGEMQLGRVDVLLEHRGDTALRVLSGRPAERGLRDDHDARTAPRGTNRRREPGDATTEHQHVEGVHRIQPTRAVTRARRDLRWSIRRRAR